MPDIKVLKEQVERAKRFAKGMTTMADRDTLLAVADDYQRKIDAASAQSVEEQSAGEQPNATATTSGAATSDAVASSDDDTPTTSTGGQPETD